jgi:hypothetical protein
MEITPNFEHRFEHQIDKIYWEKWKTTSERIEQILFPHHALVATLLFFVVHGSLHGVVYKKQRETRFFNVYV